MKTTVRTRDQWSNMRPDAVVTGSPAQVLYCIRDAQSDILHLWAEIDELRSELRSMNQAVTHNAAIDRAEIQHWKDQANGN